MIKKCQKHGYFRGEKCHCGDEGRIVLDDVRTERLGRFISGALRHFPDDLGLAMNQHGWVDIDVLCDVMLTRYKWATKDKLFAIINTDERGRYEIAGTKIRARYGHSVDIDLDLPDNQTPVLYYGASQEEADMLLVNGIKPVKQRYVHLSTTKEKAIEVASIHTENPVIFSVDAKAAQDDGIKMMTVNENIVVSEEIPPEYISKD
ncbi:MAG TPA: RNA 2'-phosphotransferase [Candidatus Methanoperedenaceae archaeon]|nr:RNA 2'-phosphotransferase [Candidatus Methanoperedenaceae archaeon]